MVGDNVVRAIHDGSVVKALDVLLRRAGFESRLGN